MKLLVVEDDDTQYNLYNDAVDDLNESNGVKIQITRYTEAKTAIENLEKVIFHAAIIDLELSNENCGNKATGNQVIQKIINDVRLPVIVVSGNLDKLSSLGEENPDGFFYKTYDRDEKHSEDIINELFQVYQTGVFNIIGGTGLIEKKLSEVFWKHLSKDIDAWIPAKEGTERSLLRYTLNHLLAYLDLEDEETNTYQNAEFYLKPPVKPTISSGDILIDDTTNSRYLLLSPACDVQVRTSEKGNPCINANTLILGKIHDVNREAFLSLSIISNQDNNKSSEKSLDNIIKGKDPKFLFLPDYKELEAGIVNLQELKTIEFSTYSSYRRVATVSRDYLKEIQSRFSSYYGRQGQPDLNKKDLLKTHKGKLKKEQLVSKIMI